MRTTVSALRRVIESVLTENGAQIVNEENTDHSVRVGLTYSVYLGFLQLQRQSQVPSLSSQQFESYVDHVIETLIPER